MASWDDLRPVLDRELNRLPEKYRAVLVLCDVEGRTRKDAARQLGCPEGSVSSRLAWARTMLAKRLARCGIVVSSGFLAILVAEHALAGVPAALVGSTLKAAALLGAGWGLATSAISSTVTALTEGALNAMLMTKIKAFSAIALVSGMFGFGGGLLMRNAPAQDGLAIKTRATEKQRDAAAPKADSEKREPRPKKLSRVPDPPPALQSELARWDSAFRHGSEEKFAELERLADELLQKYPERDNQARILYQVAHVAGQSGLDKHIDRLRKYARKALALSRDPLQRGMLYSYLGSASEIDPATKTFAARRQLAADVLLDGYAEMLAQELPETAPELPRVDKIGGDGATDPVERAKLRAQHAAQMEARKEAEFVRDLVQRRDTLANQLRWLYRPHLKVHGRNADGPEQLRALATRKLNDAAAVAALLARVTGPERLQGAAEVKWAVTDVADDLIQVSVGGKNGLKIGDTLEVYRMDPKQAYLGRLRLVALEENEAIGKLVTKTAQTVKVGDLVATKLPGK